MVVKVMVVVMRRSKVLTAVERFVKFLKIFATIKRRYVNAIDSYSLNFVVLLFMCICTSSIPYTQPHTLAFLLPFCR